MMYARITDPENPQVSDPRIRIEVQTEFDLLIAYLSPEALGALFGAVDAYRECVFSAPGERVDARFPPLGVV
jgi:hypothetical protein